MSRSHLFMPMLLVTILVGCMSPYIGDPVRIEFGASGTPSEPVRVRSGQLVALEPCCPPVELRDTSGKTLHELEYTRQPQSLVAAPGTYLIVGHDPCGEECAISITIISD